MLTPALLALSLLVAPEIARFDPTDDFSAWDRGRDSRRLADEYHHNDLAQADVPGEGLVTDWAFATTKDAYADIFVRRPIDRPFERLRIRVRNLGEPLKLAAKLADAEAAEYTVTPVDLPAGGGWQDVDFPLNDWNVASWSKDGNDQLDFPTRYLAVIGFSIKPGTEYHLQIAKIELIRPEPIVAQLEVTGLPTTLDAGGTVEAKLTLTPAAALPDDGYSGRDGRLQLASGATPVTEADVAWDTAPATWTAGKPVHGTATLVTSKWQPGGPHVWRLALAGVTYTRADGTTLDDLGPVTVNSRQARPPVAEVKAYHGAPTIHIHGQPVPQVAYAAYGPTPKVFEEFGAAGVRLFSIMGTPTSHGYGLSADTWLEPGVYDYTQLDQRFRMVLDACPDAYLFPRLYVSAPPWWLEQHPGAVVMYDPGDGVPVPYMLNGRKVPSWASPDWRAAVDDALRKLIAHVEQQPYADRIIGYHIASGCTEEWMMWGANENQWTDYGADNQAAFRRWLAQRYGTDAKLQAAWSRTDVTLATATVPPKVDRAKSAQGVLRDPAADTPSIDYIRYIADATAETIDRFCTTVKQATHGQRLAGVFYGYLLQLFGQRQQNAAHLGFDQVVRSPNVDFLCSPTSYAFRAIGTGTSHFMAPLGSVLEHGKLWFDENDIRTSLAPGEIGGWGKPETVAGDLLQQDRELANVLTHGIAQWWFDVGRNRYDDPVLMDRLAHLSRVAAATLEVDRSRVDQVAMVVDGRGLANINVGDPFMGSLQLQQLPQLARIGAPAMHYELTDVAALKRHRMVLFAGLYEPTDAELAGIEALKSDGRVLIFTHAPAPYHDGRFQPERMSQVSGIGLKLDPTAVPTRVTYTGQDRLLGEAASYGDDRPSKPCVYGDDPQAEILGTLPDGRPGLMMRKYPTWTAVWSAAPILPAAMLARLAEQAGVHRYITTPDVVWASRDLLAINVDQAGERTVRLPGKRDVDDLYSGQLIGRGIDQFTATFGAGETKLYRLR